MFKIKRKTKIGLIVFFVVAFAIIVTIGINSHKAEKLAEIEDRLIEIRLEQPEIELRLELKNIPDDVRLNNMEDLNELFEPTEETFNILHRWEVVHQIDPDYPYPKTEIENQDWGINHFLYGETEEGEARAEMIYDSSGHIDMEVYKYIMLGRINKENPTVEEAIK